MQVPRVAAADRQTDSVRLIIRVEIAEDRRSGGRPHFADNADQPSAGGGEPGGVVPARARRDPPVVGVVVRAVLRGRRRRERAAALRRAQPRPRLPAAAAPARGDRVRRALRLLARAPARRRRLRRRRGADGPRRRVRLPLDDAVPRHDRQPAVVPARVRRRPVQHDRRGDVQPHCHSGPCVHSLAELEPGLPWGRNFYPHTHRIPMGIPIPTADLVRTQYRPRGGVARRYPPPMAVRWWLAYRFAANQAICVSSSVQRSRRIYVRPRTGPQPAHLWWPAVAKLQVPKQPIKSRCAVGQTDGRTDGGTDRAVPKRPRRAGAQ